MSPRDSCTGGERSLACRRPLGAQSIMSYRWLMSHRSFCRTCRRLRWRRLSASAAVPVDSWVWIQVQPLSAQELYFLVAQFLSTLSALYSFVRLSLALRVPVQKKLCHMIYVDKKAFDQLNFMALWLWLHSSYKVHCLKGFNSSFSLW